MVSWKYLLQDRSRSHIGREITAVLGSPQYRQGIQGDGIHVIGKLTGKLRHFETVARIAIVFAPVTIKNFNRVQIGLLTYCLGLRRPRIR
jgi:hypothetical protein